MVSALLAMPPGGEITSGRYLFAGGDLLFDSAGRISCLTVEQFQLYQPLIMSLLETALTVEQFQLYQPLIMSLLGTAKLG